MRIMLHEHKMRKSLHEHKMRIALHEHKMRIALHEHKLRIALHWLHWFVCSVLRRLYCWMDFLNQTTFRKFRFFSPNSNFPVIWRITAESVSLKDLCYGSCLGMRQEEWNGAWHFSCSCASKISKWSTQELNVYYW